MKPRVTPTDLAYRLALHSAPIVIGGSGGSGTRAVAEILIRSGVYLGYDLNQSNDNLSFTYLFKHPYRFAQDIAYANPDHEELYVLHEKILFSHLPYSMREISLLLKAGWDHAYRGSYYGWRWVIKRWQRMAFRRPEPRAGSALWGWKEPHTIFFLYGIQAHYEKAKFILVLRNGLDMAYSRNDQQMVHWGPCFGIDPSDSRPQNRFEFWYRSNHHVIVTARKLFGDSFFVVKLEDLCLQEEKTLRDLFEFVGLDFVNISPEVRKIPKLPRSHSRYRQFDTSWIDARVRHKLTDIGYRQ
jgi:hypothetical protein